MATSRFNMEKHDVGPNAATPWREERVFIVPHGAGFQVVPPYKVVSKGQQVTFRSFDCKILHLAKLDDRIFEVLPRTKDPMVVTVRVREDAPAGFYPYAAHCSMMVDKKVGKKFVKKEVHGEARGASPPGMIVDP